MKRIIISALAALTLSGGVALADRHRGGNDHRGNDRHDTRGDRGSRGNDRGRVVVNSNNRGRVDRSRWSGGVRVTRSRPTFRNNTFYFGGGRSHVYRRPVIQYHYRNYYQRPSIIIENYDPVPGYVWVAGTWNWNGYEWMWVNGHYEVDGNYDGYGDGY